MSKSTTTMFGIAAAAGFFVFSGIGSAAAEPAPAQLPACPAPSEAPYPFTCTHLGDGQVIRICAETKGCVEQGFDKLGNLVCQKTGQFTPAGQPLIPRDQASNANYSLCDAEMSAVSALPPLPIGRLLPTFKG